MKWHATSMLRVCNFTPGVLSGYQFTFKGFSQAQGGMFGAAPPPPPPPLCFEPIAPPPPPGRVYTSRYVISTLPG